MRITPQRRDSSLTSSGDRIRIAEIGIREREACGVEYVVGRIGSSKQSLKLADISGLLCIIFEAHHMVGDECHALQISCGKN